MKKVLLVSFYLLFIILVSGCATQKTFSENKTVEKLKITGYYDFEAVSMADIPPINLDEAKALFESGRAVFVDARASYEYNSLHIKDAVSVPYTKSPERIKAIGKLLKGKVLIVYCEGEWCNLAKIISCFLYSAGYKKILTFFNGWLEWSNAHLPVQSTVIPEKYELLLKKTTIWKDTGIEEVKFLYDNQLVYMVDVDDADKFDEAHINGSYSIPLGEADKMAVFKSGTLKGRPVILYCHGDDSKLITAAKKFYDAGFNRLLVFNQSLPQWKKAGYPICNTEHGEPEPPSETGLEFNGISPDFQP